IKMAVTIGVACHVHRSAAGAGRRDDLRAQGAVGVPVCNCLDPAAIKVESYHVCPCAVENAVAVAVGLLCDCQSIAAGGGNGLMAKRVVGVPLLLCLGATTAGIENSGTRCCEPKNAVAVAIAFDACRQAGGVRSGDGLISHRIVCIPFG